MKSIINYSLLLFILSLGCSNAPTGLDTAMVIIVDKTDPLLVYPTTDDVSVHLGLKQDIWQGIQVTVTCISDKDVNDTEVITLEKESRWAGNTTLRKAQVAHFIDELRKALGQTTGKESLGHSIIYRSVAKQLNELKTARANKKYLLIYSDLMENDGVNFYDPETFSLLQVKPDSIGQRLENTVSIQNLNGVDVWLLYEPPTYLANHTYRITAGFYKQLLESKGATTHIEKSFNP
jgi:hypothetical protein